MKVALVVCFLATQAICLRNRGFVQDTPLVLEWEFDKDYIDVEIIWNSKSFVSLQLGSKMAKTDFWVCSQEANDSAWRVADYWSIGHSKPKPDISLDGTEDLTHQHVLLSNSSVVCKFRRKLNTGDPLDLVLPRGKSIRICGMRSETANLHKHKSLEDVFCFYWPLKEGVHNNQLLREKAPGTLKLAHGIGLTICWALLVDCGIISIRYFRTHKYYKLAHMTFFLVITAASLPLIGLMVVRERVDIFHNFEFMDVGKKMHTVLGFSTVLLLMLEHSLGLVTKWFQEDSIRPAGLFGSVKKVHKLVGYSLSLITKVEVLNGWWIYHQSKSVVIAIVVVWFTFLFVFRMALEEVYRSGRLSSLVKCFSSPKRISGSKREPILKINESLLEEAGILEEIRQGRSRRELKGLFPGAKYVFFRDMVCWIEGFNHPGGNSIFEQVIGQDVTKYIYGVASLEGNRTKAYSHSPGTTEFLANRSFGTYLQPSLTLPSPEEWHIREITELTPSVFRFILTNRNFSMDTNPSNWKDYLGRYVVATTSLTRPYTIVLSELSSNVSYRRALLQAYHNNFQLPLDNLKRETKTNNLVLIVRKYPQGSVSKELHSSNTLSKVSGIYGRGLDIRDGLNVIITGGTGILPFLDLFDLLLKATLLRAASRHSFFRSHPNCDYNAYNLNFENVYPRSRFILYVSFRSLQQLSYYSWLIELHHISRELKLGIFELYVKDLECGGGVGSFRGRIDKEFLLRCVLAKGCSKVLVCGPPSMGEELFGLFKQLQVEEDIYSIL